GACDRTQVIFSLVGPMTRPLVALDVVRVLDDGSGKRIVPFMHKRSLFEDGHATREWRRELEEPEELREYINFIIQIVLGLVSIGDLFIFFMRVAVRSDSFWIYMAASLLLNYMQINT
ncbi:hypothetical protein ACJX0J_014653, partial [Zea mays]